jgi:hypothetical protein
MSSRHATIALLLGLECTRGSVAVAQARPAAEDVTHVQPASALPETTSPAAATVAIDPPADVQATYREVVTRAVAEFDAGRSAEARALFLRAHELWPSARTLRTLGMTAFELRMYPRALEELQRALDDPRRPLPDDQRAEVLALIEQTRAYVGRYRLQLSPPGAELLVDGSPSAPGASVLVLALGDHALLARVAGYAELRRVLVVQGREDEDLTLRLEPLSPSPVLPAHGAAQEPASVASVLPRVQDASAPASAPNRTPAIVAFCVGGVGVAVGTAAGIIALGKKRDVNQESGHRAADISTAAFITAGVSAVIGTVLWLTASPANEQDADNTASLPRGHFVRPIVGLGAIGVDGRL